MCLYVQNPVGDSLRIVSRSSSSKYDRENWPWSFDVAGKGKSGSYATRLLCSKQCVLHLIQPELESLEDEWA